MTASSCPRDAVYDHLREPSSRIVAAALVALVIVGLWLRARGLGDWAPSGDDALHLHRGMGRDFVDTLARTRPDTHPPLLYLLLQVVQGPLGVRDLLALRAVSLVPGVLFIPLAFLIGERMWHSRSIGLVLAGVVTFGALPVLLSQPIRQYSLMLAFLGLSLVGMASRGRMGPWLYGGGAALAIASNFSAVFLVAGGGLALLPGLLRGPRRAGSLRGALLRWALLHAALAGEFALLLLRYLQTGSPTPSENYMATSLPADLGAALINLGRACTSVLVEGPLGLVLGAVLVGGLAGALLCRRFDAVLYAIVPLALALAAGLAGVYPITEKRWCVYLVLPDLVLVGSFVHHMTRWNKLKAVPVVRWAVSLSLVALIGGGSGALRLGHLYHRENVHWPFRLDDYRSFLEWERRRLDQSAAVLTSGAEKIRRQMSTTHFASWGLPTPPAGLRVPADVWELQHHTALKQIAAALADLKAQTLLAPISVARASPDVISALAASPCLKLRDAEFHETALLLAIDVVETRARLEQPTCRKYRPHVDSVSNPPPRGL